MRGQNIVGDLVVLRPADIEDRRRIYEWLACSDIAGTMSGPPTFPERPVPTWEEFEESYFEHYFNDSAPLLGRCFLIQVEGTPIGQINYNDIEEHQERKRTELDIWMRSRKYCGKGFGVDAIVTLCRFLSEQYGVEEFMVQPSARNPQAIRAYEKAGFRRLEVSNAEERHSWGPCDYEDSVHMIKRLWA